MKDNGIFCEFVEVGYRLDEDRRGCGYGGKFTSTDRGEARKKRVSILLDGEKLRGQLADRSSKESMLVGHKSKYLWLLLCNNASGFVLLQLAKCVREVGRSGERRLDGDDHIAGKVSDAGHCNSRRVSHELGTERVAGRWWAVRG